METQVRESLVADTHVAPERTSSVAELSEVAGPWAAISPYLRIARPDHWFKNIFMLIGVLVAWLYAPPLVGTFNFGLLMLGLLSTCLVASSNYVINEILDAPTDLDHPVKRHRPIPSGRVRLSIAYAEWILLGVVGLGMAAMVNGPFLIASGLLLLMGLVYNIRPIRSKDVPYLDVLSESVNNPLRLALGWFLVIPEMIPPMSLIVSYWLVGAFFMASKRFAEYRSLGSKQVAAAYRRSFCHYDESRLLVSMFVYTTGAALLLGVFIIRYHLELILCVPLIGGFFGYYVHVTLKPDSAAQNPERLYRERGLMFYLGICLMAFVGLMFVEIPALYGVFNVEPSRVPALWRM